MKIRVLTYNIHGAHGTDGLRDYRRLGELLKKNQIDIALIQELDTRAPDRDGARDIADLRTDHFREIVEAPTMHRDSGWYGNAILSRFPVTRRNVIDISTGGREPRNIVEVFLRTPCGPLHVVNTHKGLGALERKGQLRKLNELLARKCEVPLIVGGDINEWQSFAGGLRRLNQVLHPIPSGATFPTRFPLFALDRMWCRPDHLIQSSRVLKTEETRVYSDHYPLLAEFFLPVVESGANA